MILNEKFDIILFLVEMELLTEGRQWNRDSWETERSEVSSKRKTERERRMER